jgi:hypothetical protein
VSALLVSVSPYLRHLTKEDVMEPGAAVSAVKEAVSLKLETPFMFLASLSGSLGMSCIVINAWNGLLDVFGIVPHPFPPPLEAVSKFWSWTGWASASTWTDGIRNWIVDPARSALLHPLFFAIALIGVVFAAYGTRLAFCAMLGIGGLVELGSTTAAWLVPLLALIGSVLVGRIIESLRHTEHGIMTCFHLMLAFFFPAEVVYALIVGERQRSAPQPVKFELSSETRRYIDQRLKAFGMPSLIPVVEKGRPIA